MWILLEDQKPERSGWYVIDYLRYDNKWCIAFGRYNVKEDTWTLGNNKTKVIPESWSYTNNLLEF